jgi:hypothetical protein
MASWKLSNGKTPPIDRIKRPAEISIAYGVPKSLLETEGCRFIMEGGNLCCNAEQSGGSAYCEIHRRLCGGK